jgi:hypothetical protein
MPLLAVRLQWGQRIFSASIAAVLGGVEVGEGVDSIDGFDMGKGKETGSGKLRGERCFGFEGCFALASDRSSRSGICRTLNRRKR